jgi:hypothetical protein
MSSEHNTTSNGFGVALAFVLIGFFLLSLIKFLDMSGVFMWLVCFASVVLVIVGLIGTCIELPGYIKEIIQIKVSGNERK